MTHSHRHLVCLALAVAAPLFVVEGRAQAQQAPAGGATTPTTGPSSQPAPSATPPPPPLPPPPPAERGGPAGGGPQDVPGGAPGPGERMGPPFGRGPMGGPGRFGPGPDGTGMGPMGPMEPHGGMPPWHGHRAAFVEIDSSRPDTVVEKRASESETHGWMILPTRSHEERWEPVCITPCRVGLDRYASYRVREQNGVSGSPTFTLPQQDERVALRVDAGNAHVHHLGQALALTGTAALVVGAALLVAAPHVVDSDREKNTRLAGFITGGAGLVLFTIGMPITAATTSRVYAGDRNLTCHH